MNVFEFCFGLILSLIICLGSFGNTLSFLVWTMGRRCKKLPGGIYLRALAISDNLALVAPALGLAVSFLSGYNPADEYNSICKVEIVGRHFGLCVSTWKIVSFTVERTLDIFRPVSFANLVSKKGTIVLITAIFIVNFWLNFPFGVVYRVAETAIIQYPKTNIDLSKSPGNISDDLTADKFETGTEIIGYKMRCLADKTSIFHYNNWYHIWFMDAFLIFIIPFGLMTGCNFMVLYLVVSSKRSTQSKLDSKIRAVTMRAVTISVVHCVTSGPFAMGVLIPGYFARAMSVKYSKEYYIARISLVLAYMNHAINFFLHSFFGSEFRRDCAEILKKIRPRVHPEGSNIRPSDGLTGEDRSRTQDSHLNKPDNSKTVETIFSPTCLIQTDCRK